MSASRFPLWFGLAMLPMVASQLLRLQQSEPGWWLVCDYAGRLGMIAALAAMPQARQVAFVRVPAKLDSGQIAIWIIMLVLLEYFVLRFPPAALTHYFPPARFGLYPRFDGALYWFDITAGLLLVAYSEELLFRRCARISFGSWLGDGWKMVIATSIFFGAYHWWSGIWNVLGATIAGFLFMSFYRRSGALYPVVIVHYIFDVILLR
jgi:membrane protease YdiL (CAAX protease family)